MDTATGSQFAASLDERGVSLTRTTPGEFAATIDRIVTEPAIGVPLSGYDGVSLAETVVETELTPRRLHEAETGVTPIGNAIAEYGSLFVESDAAGSEPVSLYAPTHVGVLRESDVLPDMAAAIDAAGENLRDGGSTVFATGVSATGDMGATVEGVHGPKNVHVVVLTDR